jgi:hypothetical protein
VVGTKAKLELSVSMNLGYMLKQLRLFEGQYHNSPSVEWSLEKTVLVVKDTRIVLQEVQKHIYEEIKLLKSNLNNDILCSALPHIFGKTENSMGNLIEDWHDKSVGYGFMSEPRNAHLAGAGWRTMTALSKTNAFPEVANCDLSKLMDCPGPVKAELQSFFEKTASWLEQMVALCFVTLGVPPRGSEYCATGLLNSATRSRNVYLLPKWGTVLLRGMYNKTGERQAMRMLPQPLASLLVAYIIHVRPLEVLWAPYVFTKDSIYLYKSLLWVSQGKMILSETLSAKMQSLVGMNLNQWRHFTLAVMRDLILPSRDHDDDIPISALESPSMDEEDEILEAVLPHTTLMTEDEPAVETLAQDTDLDRFHAGFDAGLTLSDSWHKWLGIYQDTVAAGTA